LGKPIAIYQSCGSLTAAPQNLPKSSRPEAQEPTCPPACL